MIPPRGRPGWRSRGAGAKTAARVAKTFRETERAALARIPTPEELELELRREREAELEAERETERERGRAADAACSDAIEAELRLLPKGGRRHGNP